MATFSAGAVAPGDGVGQSNASLIMRSVNGDGKLLKPTRPMGTVDRWYAATAFGRPDSVRWQMWSTYTELTARRWYYVLATDNAAMNVTLQDLHVGLNTALPATYYAHTQVQGVDDYSSLRPVVGGVVAVPSTALPSFTITQLSPILLPAAVVVLGERDKWVRVSPQRLTSLVDVTASGVTMSVEGAGGEVVQVDYALVDRNSTTGLTKVMTATCTIPDDGSTTLTIASVDGTASCGVAFAPTAQVQLDEVSVLAPASERVQVEEERQQTRAEQWVQAQSE